MNKLFIALALLLALAGLLFVSACGDDENNNDDDPCHDPVALCNDILAGCDEEGAADCYALLSFDCYNYAGDHMPYYAKCHEGL